MNRFATSGFSLDDIRRLERALRTTTEKMFIPPSLDSLKQDLATELANRTVRVCPHCRKDIR